MAQGPVPLATIQIRSQFRELHLWPDAVDADFNRGMANADGGPDADT